MGCQLGRGHAPMLRRRPRSPQLAPEGTDPRSRPLRLGPVTFRSWPRLLRVIASSPLLTANGLPDAEIVATHPPFEAAYALHVAAVDRFCLSQVRDPNTAEDATAEVFAAALKAYDRVRPGAGVSFWLFRIARNTVVSHHRRRARESDLSRLIRESPPTEDDVQLAAGVREELREVAAVVATMRRRDRTLIGLRLAAQLTYAEIGAVVGRGRRAFRGVGVRPRARSASWRAWPPAIRPQS